MQHARAQLAPNICQQHSVSSTAAGASGGTPKPAGHACLQQQPTHWPGRGRPWELRPRAPVRQPCAPIASCLAYHQLQLAPRRMTRHNIGFLVMDALAERLAPGSGGRG